MPYTPVQTNGKSYTIQKLLGSIKMDKMAIRDDRIFHVTTHHLCHYFYVSAGNEESKTFCYCCDRKVRAACAQSFTLWQQATIEIIRRDHSIIACSFHIYMGIILRTHPIHGESHIQCNTNREVATTTPSFYNKPHRSHVLFVKSAPGTNFTSWSKHHFVAIRKTERQVRKASHCGSKQQ